MGVLERIIPAHYRYHIVQLHIKLGLFSQQRARNPKALGDSGEEKHGWATHLLWWGQGQKEEKGRQIDTMSTTNEIIDKLLKEQKEQLTQLPYP